MRLTHRHFDGVNVSLGEHTLSDALREMLKKLDRWPGDDCGDGLRYSGVVDRVGDRVGGGRRTGIKLHHHVNDEALPEFSFLRVDTVAAWYVKPNDRNNCAALRTHSHSLLRDLTDGPPGVEGIDGWCDIVGPDHRGTTGDGRKRGSD